MSDELGNSAVPYNPIIVDTYLKGKQPFQPTFFEWISIRGNQIFRSQFINGAGSDTYTVPEGYTLFVTHVNIWADSWGSLYYAAATSVLLLEVTANNTSNITPVIPITLGSGEKLFFENSGGAGTKASWSLIGFLIKNDVIPQI